MSDIPNNRLSWQPRPRPAPAHQFSHQLKPATVRELQQIGVRFVTASIGGYDHWPALVLPSGKVLAVASDDEGNGPGAFHEFNPV
jgi:hypothetical protein